MTMTVTAFVMYAIANVVGILLFWLFQQRSKRSEEEMVITDDHVVKKRKFKHQPSLFTLLGIGVEGSLPFYAIDDHFSSFREVSTACKKAGLEKCGLIIGVDFTASNEWQGRKSFSGNSLHKLMQGKISNPYQKVISVVGQTLEPFNDGGMISAYGFGDAKSAGDTVFPFINADVPCKGFSEVLDRYDDIAARVTLSGPTNFAPLIYRAIEIVRSRNLYHILVIIADGQVNEEDKTIQAIVEASKFPLSIVVVGVGDGPWDLMEEFDDHLPNREFDNFQFVNFHAARSKVKHPDANFSLHVMMEIPLQYRTIKQLGYLSHNGDLSKESQV